MTTLDKISDYVDQIIKERKRVLPRVMKQYVELRNFGGLYNHPKVNAYEFNPYFDNLNVTFAKKKRRALRVAIGIERKEARYFENLLTQINNLLVLLPNPYFDQLAKIKRTLETYHAETVRLLSQKGVFDEIVKSNKDLRNVAEQLIPQVEHFIENTTVPFMAALKELDAFTHKKAQIISAKRPSLTLDIPINSFYTNRGVNPDTILADTSFLREVIESRETQRKEFIDLHLPDQSPVRKCPIEVEKEGIACGRKNEFKKIFSKENFEILNVTLTKEEEREILYFWEQTKKYRESSAAERAKFINSSADIKLLALALRRAKKNHKVSILSQDGDIVQTVRRAKFIARNTHPHWRNIFCVWYYLESGLEWAA